MDIETITTIISNTGFPIAVSIGLFWYINKQSENHRNAYNELQQIINENTQILGQLKELIGVLVSNGKTN